MSEESVAASIHMHFTMAFHKTLFHKYAPGDSDEKVEKRLLFADNYAWQ